MKQPQLHERMATTEKAVQSLQKTSADTWEELRKEIGYVRGVLDALVYYLGKDKVQAARNELNALMEKAQKEALEKREQEMLDQLREGVEKGFIRQVSEVGPKSMVFCRLRDQPLIVNIPTDERGAKALVGKTVGDVVEYHTVLMIFEHIDQLPEA